MLDLYKMLEADLSQYSRKTDSSHAADILVEPRDARVFLWSMPFPPRGLPQTLVAKVVGSQPATLSPH